MPTSHPLAKFLLQRDLVNVNRFFSRLGVRVLSADEAYRQVVGSRCRGKARLLGFLRSELVF